MPTQFIKATKSNLKEGCIIIQATDDGTPYGELMICNSSKDEVKKTGIANCMVLDKNGLGKSREIKIKNLARVLDHETKRKLRPEELFKY